VLGERWSYTHLTCTNSSLNLAEGVLRMHGTSLRALTACGVPEELVAAVLLFLASPGAKVYMDKHWHRVRDVGHSAIALPDGKGFLVEQQARGGAYAPGTPTLRVCLERIFFYCMGH